MKKFLIILALFLISSNLLLANDKKSKTFFIGGMPQYALINSLRIETEYRPINSNIAFTFSPQIYAGYLGTSPFISINNRYEFDQINKNNSFVYNDDEMFGFGFETSFKYYIDRGFLVEDDVNLYFALGLGFNNINYKLINSDINGIINSTRNITVNRIFPELQLGGTFFFWEKVMVDTYLGVGLKIPFVNSATPLRRRFDDDFFTDKGTYYFLGVKIGFFLF